MHAINYPKVVCGKDQKVYIDLKLDGKRMRLFHGRKFDLELCPNSYPENQRLNQANILAAQIYAKLISGASPMIKNPEGLLSNQTDLYYIKEELKRGEPQHNIFTSSNHSPNPDYFKTLWSHFKRVSLLLEKEQTLYSFRCTGTIEIYKRTGSIEKLKSAMGHPLVLVSLTYLKSLDIAELKEEDMPMI